MVKRSLILIGFMASGKTHVAHALAKSVNLPMIDLDKYLERNAGESIPHIFGTHGEKYFRRMETDILQRVLQECATAPAIVSTGGGIVVQDANRALFKKINKENATVIYLRATPQTLAKRIRQEPGARPLIDGDGLLNVVQTEARVKVLLQERSTFYEECADVIIDTDGLSIEDVVGKILGAPK